MSIILPTKEKGGFIKMPGGFIMKWADRTEDKILGLLNGGYVALSYLGVKFLQRFWTWGSASIGDQKEFVARAELTLRQVNTAGLLHLELFNPDEARLCILNFKVWKGWNLFFIVNFGIRLTAASQSVRGQKMREIMLNKAKKEQAERLQARQMQQRVDRQRAGHPWPPRKA